MRYAYIEPYLKDAQKEAINKGQFNCMVVLERGLIEKYNAQLNATKTNACDIITLLIQHYFNIDKFVDVNATETGAAKTTTIPSSPCLLN